MDTSSAEPSGGVLVVKRTSPQDIKMRDLYVLVDELGEETLLFGETYEVPLSAGEHRLKITNRLYSRSETFEIKAGETVRFVAANVVSKGLLTVLMAITGSGAYRVKLERV